MSFKYILGIQSYANHDSGASIVRFNTLDNSIDYVCISEERLIRKKHPYTFPLHSIGYCMDYFGLKSVNKINLLVSDWIKERKWLRSGPSYNYTMFDYLKEKFKLNKNKIIQIDHHLAHAASVYYPSNFKDSAILVADGLGSNLETTSYYEGKKNRIIEIDKYRNHGIGAAYKAVTEHILNLGIGGEGKTMGLAPYGKKYKGKLRIKMELDGIKNDFNLFMKKQPLADILNQINSNYRPDPLKFSHKFCKKKNHLNSYFSGVAYDIQSASEKVMSHLGKDIEKKIKSKNICLSGGVALNSVANKKLVDGTNFKNIYIFPACSDAGIPFGAALWGAVNKFSASKNFKLKFDNAYTGKNYDSIDVKKLLKKFKINFSKYKDLEIAKLISKGKIIGRLFGKSEYGPRALGNRSILADARNKKIRDYINKSVKHREIFRPFAPCILEEENKKFFDLKTASPYMLLVAKSKKPKLIPSAIHVDGTARVQTVNKKQNLKFYNLIKTFQQLTGVPCVLNTSFNDAGEPLVETPLDALLCFLKTKIDFLIIEDCLVSRPANTKILIKRLDSLRKSLVIKREKELLSKLMNKLSSREYANKKRKAEKLAVDRSIYEANRKFNKLLTKFKNKKILLAGTSDHTKALCKLNKKILEKSSLDYFEYPFNDFLKKSLQIKEIRKVKKISSLYDIVIISSFEYVDKIKEKLKKKFKNTDIYSLYDNCSRSVIDTCIIKRDKGKKKIYENGIFEKI